MFEMIYKFASGLTKTISRKTENSKASIDRIGTKDFRFSITNEKSHKLYWLTHSGSKRVLSWPGGSIALEASEAGDNAEKSGGKLRPLKLTMPGKVLSIKAKEGAVVETGAPLVIVEAMKMENILMAAAKAKIAKIHIKEGDLLESGATLISFEEA